MSTSDIGNCIKLMSQIGCLKVDNNKTNDKTCCSPIQIDLTQLFRYPPSINIVQDLYWSLLKDNQFDILCGIPFCGLSISYILAYLHNLPFVIKREKYKSYGTRKLIDGVFKENQRVVIVDDVVKSGNSILLTAEALRQVGLIVTDAVTLIDCNEGAEHSLNKLGIKLKSIMKMDDLANFMANSNEMPEIDQQLMSVKSKSTPLALNDDLNIIDKLFDSGGVKVEGITLKSGLVSPIYVDLRVVSGYPQLLKPIADLYWSVLKTIDFDLICGVPFGALSFAVILAYEHNIPLAIEPNQAKLCGDSILINEKFEAGKKVVLIEDVVTSGKSLLETAQALREKGLIVNNSIAFLDRNQGGVANLSKYDMNLKSVLNIDDILKKIELTDKDLSIRLSEWFRNNQESIDN